MMHNPTFTLVLVAGDIPATKELTKPLVDHYFFEYESDFLDEVKIKDLKEKINAVSFAICSIDLNEPIVEVLKGLIESFKEHYVKFTILKTKEELDRYILESKKY